MIQVKFNNKLFTGETKDELIKKMHLARLSLRNISDTLTEQVDSITHETVRTKLIEQGIYNPDRDIPELDRAETFIAADEEIASKLNIPVSAVIRARKKFNLRSSKKFSSVNLARRRLWLSDKLFGHKPGPKFSEFLLDIIDNLPEKRAELIEAFYVTGLDSVPAREGYERSYRKKAVGQLVQLVQNLDKNVLIEDGVILSND